MDMVPCYDTMSMSGQDVSCVYILFDGVGFESGELL